MLDIPGAVFSASVYPNKRAIQRVGAHLIQIFKRHLPLEFGDGSDTKVSVHLGLACRDRATLIDHVVKELDYVGL